MTRSFLKGINEGFLVSDLTNKNIFKEIDYWFNEMKRSKNAQIILIVNKKTKRRKSVKKKQMILHHKMEFNILKQISKIMFRSKRY
jgi:GTPase SAR1 family protein